MNIFKKIIVHRLNILRGKSSYLGFVYLDTTGACTNRCYMCPVRAAKKKRKYMADEIFKKIIDELGEYNFSGQLHLYGQDEPLLDKKLFERLDYAHKVVPNAKLGLISNFTFMDDTKMEDLLNAPINRLTNSIYALDSDSYKKICGRDNFNKAITNLIRFSMKWAKKQPYLFSVQLIDNEYNKHDIDFIEFFLHKFPVRVTSRMALIGLRGLEERKKRPMLFDEDLYHFVKITGNGDMSLCPFDPDSDLYIGNVSDTTIMEAMDGEKARKIRNDIFYNRSNMGENFCDVCDCVEEHKILYFFLPFRNKTRQRIYSFLNIHRERSKALEIQKPVMNSPEQVKEKLVWFEKRFQGDGDDWTGVISKLRKEFNVTGKKEIGELIESIN